ncbi:MAG: transposase [Eubacteriaceae bacterium]|nr:transposase [Eubacteriaceae bacterium]
MPVCQGGVSARKVERSLESLGIENSKSKASRLCAEHLNTVEEFRERHLGGVSLNLPGCNIPKR